MAKVHVLSTDNMRTGNAVEAHSPNCQHLARYAKHPWFEPGFSGDFDSPQEIFNDYNADFYAEGGDESCWPIMVYPCTGLVDSGTEIMEWVN